MSGRSAVLSSLSPSPLRLLSPKNHGHAAWVFQASYGGGFVGTDRVSLSVTVEANSSLYLSSQASSKVYRGAQATGLIEADLAEGSLLVAWPDPLVCFRGSSFSQRLAFRMHETASLLCVDSFTAGRVASGERWDFDRLSLRLRVDRHDGRHDVRLLDDAVVLDPRHGPLRERLAHFDAFATVVLAGPKLAPHARALHDEIAASAPSREGVLVVASAWPWGLQLRLAAPDPQQLTDELQRLLRTRVDGLLGDDPWERKW